MPEWASKPEFWEAAAAALSFLVSVVAMTIALRDSSTREKLNERVEALTSQFTDLSAARLAQEQQLSAQNRTFQSQIAAERETFDRQLAQDRAFHEKQLSRQAQARSELHHLKDALSTSLNAFGALVAHPYDSNEELIRSAREAIDTVGPLRQAASRALVLKSRHKKELDQLEKYLTEVLLDITRDEESRTTKQYIDMSRRHQADLERWRRRASWLIDAAVIGVKSAGTPTKRVTK